MVRVEVTDDDLDFADGMEEEARLPDPAESREGDQVPDDGYEGRGYR